MIEAQQILAIGINAGILLVLTGVYMRLGEISGEIGAIKERLNSLEKRMEEKQDKPE